MEDCLFCKIVKEEVPSKKVYEDNEILAFYEPLIGKIYSVINKIAEEKGFKKDGFRIINNCGKNGGQEVMHLHFHVLAGTKLGEKIV